MMVGKFFLSGFLVVVISGLVILDRYMYQPGNEAEQTVPYENNMAIDKFQKPSATLPSPTGVTGDKDMIIPSIPSPRPTSLSLSPSLPPDSTQSQVWKYPGSRATLISNNLVRLLTSDSTGDVTDWYDSHGVTLGYDRQTRITTRANEVVENRLVFVKGEEMIQVRVSTDAQADETLIEVNFD